MGFLDVPGLGRAAADLLYPKKADPGQPSAEGFTGYMDLVLDSAKRMLRGTRQVDGAFELFTSLIVGGQRISKEANDQYVKATIDSNLRVLEDALGPDGRVPAWVLKAFGSRVVQSDWPFTPLATETVKTVKQDGTGDYTTIGAALSAITALAPVYGIKNYVLVVSPGIYNEQAVVVPSGLTIRGLDRRRCIIRGYLTPANLTDATIVATSTINLFESAALENLTITGQNLRYPVHFEGAGTNPDRTINVRNCHIEHFGNQEVRDWRDANTGSGLSSSTVWNSWIAWGEGAASGITVYMENTTMRARSPFYLHDNRDFAKLTRHHLKNCRLIGVDQNAQQSVFTINPIGSGQDNPLILESCEIETTYVQEQDAPWSSSAPAQQVANKSQIRMFLDQCSVVGFVSQNRGKALRITSASVAATSTVRVSGTAADVIFGVTGLPIYKDGGGGLQGYAYGYWDISGILTAPTGGTEDTAVNNTLGKRLGNCSTVNKTLSVSVDGGAAINVVFSTDLTAVSNATIISTLNTALGSAAVAAEYLVSQGETYPHANDREMELINDGTVGIARFSPVRYGGTQRAVQLFGTADAVALFVGVALEAIAPGKSGRILTEGKMRYDQLNGISAGFAVGSAISLSTTTAGRFETGSAKQVATAWVTDWARFKGAK